ncbi:class I SAM-dependent methyltransferase [Fodinicola acaciae]|uniref:class I SAM-dependent methyltransferase n=1 Tax=Fodinicola acaciae TaxID=2681555 RepID=UPI001C9E9D52|nr:class I SAM-dependent methyltransferase [Fodinicola acaciae]
MLDRMMNAVHRWLCSSRMWANAVEKPLTDWLAGAGIGDDVVEIGPGYGATTRVLADHCERLTAVEVDPVLAVRLENTYGDRIEVIRASGADVPLDSAAYSGVVCFTMLHHVSPVAAQDALFAEARRLLRPGGVFAGVDSLPSLGFRLLHIGDTMVPVSPATLPARLSAAGFSDVRVEATRSQVRFHARRL